MAVLAKDRKYFLIWGTGMASDQLVNIFARVFPQHPVVYQPFDFVFADEEKFFDLVVVFVKWVAGILETEPEGVVGNDAVEIDKQNIFGDGFSIIYRGHWGYCGISLGVC